MPQQQPVFELTAIGRIRTGFDTLAQCPSASRMNPAGCVIELDPAFESGLTNIELASHLIVLYWLDRSDRSALLRSARPGEVQRGVFASRSPNRPNPVAVSVVKLEGRQGHHLRVSGLDALNGTPIVDIKPYVPEDDRIEDARIGWNSACTKVPARGTTTSPAQPEHGKGCGCASAAGN